MTALTMVQRAASRLGLSAPSAVFSSTDAQIIQLRNLMNQEGVELGKRHAWTKLTKEKTFSTTAAAVQTSAVPSDFNWYINDTMWNRSTDEQIIGPMTPMEWQQEQALAVATFRPRFRFRGGDILIFPTPTASQTAAYEYVSIWWAETSAGAGGSLAAMTADTDVALLDESLIVLGILWRFKEAKGLDYSEYFRTYEMEVSRAIGRDGGRNVHNLGGRTPPRYRGNIPENNWTI